MDLSNSLNNSLQELILIHYITQLDFGLLIYCYKGVDVLQSSCFVLVDEVKDLFLEVLKSVFTALFSSDFLLLHLKVLLYGDDDFLVLFN